MTEFSDYDSADYLTTPVEIAAYVEAALDETLRHSTTPTRADFLFFQRAMRIAERAAIRLTPTDG